MILLIDNYDSFTYNLYDYLARDGQEVKVVLNDEFEIEEIAKWNPKGIVLSPGPKTPKETKNLMEVIDANHKTIPILGICLGHQAIGQYFGGTLTKAPIPVHGKTSQINHNKAGLFENLPNPMEVMRYHSLMVNYEDDQLTVTASTDNGISMAFQHKHLPISSLQFHPESILTTHGLRLIQNWIKSLKTVKS